MKVPELDELIVRLIRADGHPEIVSVEPCESERVGATYHARLKVTYANGGSSTIMVFQVIGPKGASAKYTVPQEVV